MPCVGRCPSTQVGVGVPPVAVVLLIPAFVSFIIFPAHSGVPMLGACMLIIAVSSWTHHLIVMSYPLKYIFLTKYGFLAFVSFTLLSVCVSLGLKCVSCQQFIHTHVGLVLCQSVFSRSLS